MIKFHSLKMQESYFRFGFLEVFHALYFERFVGWLDQLRESFCPRKRSLRDLFVLIGLDTTFQEARTI